MADYAYKLPPWSGELRNLYARLRATRSGFGARSEFGCTRRTRYRRIALEKNRLLALGVDPVELHLLTRVLSNVRNENARQRLFEYQTHDVLQEVKGDYCWLNLGDSPSRQA